VFLDRQHGPVILITGGSGNVGAATVHSLVLHFPSSRIRVGARPQSLARARERLKGIEGLEFVDLDTRLPQTVDAAFKGAHVVLFVPPVEDRVAVCKAYTAAALKAGVSFIAVIGTILGVNDTLIFGRQWREIENGIIATGISFCFVRLPMFAENHLLSGQFMKATNSLQYPVAPDARFSYIALSDVGLVLAHILARWEVHRGKTYVVAAKQSLSCNELVAIFSKVLGRKITFQAVPIQAAVDAMVTGGMAPWQANGIAELFREAGKGNCDVSPTYNAFSAVTGSSNSVDFERWLRRGDVLEAFK